MRPLALVAGVALIGLAFAAATRVTDSREGLVAEVVTLLGAVAGIGLLMYVWMSRPRPGAVAAPAPRRPEPDSARPRSAWDLVLGVSGVALALALLAGLAVTGGPLWAGLGLALLLPMLAGCVYLCVRYLRSAS